MTETIHPEDNLKNGPTSVPPLPYLVFDRLNKVELKTDGLSQELDEIKKEIKENSRAIDRLANAIVGQEKAMDAKFAAQEKAMDAKFAAQEKAMDAKFATQEKAMDAKLTAQEKTIDNRFADLVGKFAALEKRFSKLENWIIGFIIACAGGLISLLLKSNFGF